MLGGVTETHYQQWADAADRHQELTLPNEVLSRVGAVLSIHQAVVSLYKATDEQLGWLRRPHQSAPFYGRPPIELVSSGALPEMMAVLTFLQAAGQGIYMPPNRPDLSFRPYSASVHIRMSM